MSRNISVRGVRREQVDLDRLAAAIAALAAEQQRQEEAEQTPAPHADDRKEAA